jgi:hypothetical protein
MGGTWISAVGVALSTRSVLAIVAAVVTLLLLVLFLIVAPKRGLYEDVASAQVPNGNEWPLTGHQSKMLVLVGTGVLLGLAAVAGMWLTTAGFHDLARHPRPRAAWWSGS